MTVRSVRKISITRKLTSALRMSFVKEERGSAMVEFAIVAGLIFIPLVFGIIEFGRLVWAKNMVTSAAREGVRYSIVHSTADSATIADYVKGRTKLSPIIVSPSHTGIPTPGADTAMVTVTYTYTPVMKLPGMPASKTVTGTSRQIIAF